jgi:hypothetical protein
MHRLTYVCVCEHLLVCLHVKALDRQTDCHKIWCWECKIWGFHSGGYEEFCLVGYNVIYPLKVIRRFGETCRLQLQGRRISQVTVMKQVVSDIFRRNVGWLITEYTALFPSSESKKKPGKKPAWSRSQALCSSQTFVGFQHIAWRYIPEDRTHVILGSFTKTYRCTGASL